MNEFLNFHDSWILVQHNWVWLAAAFLIGTYVGFTFNMPSDSKQ